MKFVNFNTGINLCDHQHNKNTNIFMALKTASCYRFAVIPSLHP